MEPSTMTKTFIPYGLYWSTPFAKWQGSLAHLHSLKLAAQSARQALEAKAFPLATIDLAVLGITNPQVSSFYGLPWLTGMLGIGLVTGPTVQQACATGARALKMAAQEVADGSADCALVVAADRCSNGAIVYYPDNTAPGGRGITEAWVIDNFGNDPYARNAMVDTAENAARRFNITIEQQHEVVLRRYEQYRDALLTTALQRCYDRC
jgi:acetyl-CoA acetyltransferase